MENVKEFIFVHWFYLLGFLYIANCIFDIISRIIDKEIDFKVDVTDMNSINESNKDISVKVFKRYYVLFFIASLSWVLIGINYTTYLENIYFKLILFVGWIVKLIIGMIGLLIVADRMKKSGTKKINTKELNGTSLLRNQKIFSHLINVFEIVIVCMILNNHFKLI